MPPHLAVVLVGVTLVLAGLVTVLCFSTARIYRALRRRTGPRWRVVASCAILVTVGAATTKTAILAKGATVEQTAVDVAMLAAYRSSPSRHDLVPRGYVLLAGDLHCHVSPPDEAYHASRGLVDTVRLARSEGLDFVGLTPHVWTRDLTSGVRRAELLEGHRDLVRRVAATDTQGVMLTVGAESTDDGWGHVAMVFGSLDEALGGVTDSEVAGDLSGLFTRYVESGGLLILNHPLLQPVDLPVPGLTLDLSWRPFTAPRASFPLHIVTANRLAVGVEAQNLLVSVLRDSLAFRDSLKTTRDVMARLDEEILRTERRLAPTGGSDSHSHHLRQMMFVLATARTLAAVRDAILGGRVCVRDAAACSLEVRRPSGDWQPVGSSVMNVERVEIRVRAADADVLRNGVFATRVPADVVTAVDTPPDRCTLVRVSAGGGFSGVVYANCAFAN